MKQIVCEMCGNSNLVKQDGYFICQFCGCKYTVEEAKKMMIEGTVDVQGTVKIDNSSELEKLYQAARNARETDDSEMALKHYEKISALDPNSWEALFFLTILKTENITNGQIRSAAISIQNCLEKVFQLIKSEAVSEEKQVEAIALVSSTCFIRACSLFGACKEFRKGLTKGTGLMSLTGLSGAIMSASHNQNVAKEDLSRSADIANIMCLCGNYIEEIFGMQNEKIRNIAVQSWKFMLSFHNDYQNTYKRQPLFSAESVKQYGEKIKKYEPDYQIEEPESSGGCYVATCVYGAYDCPEVWTLRRYRDNTLYPTWYGRAFIKMYYAISPTLVKWFGKTQWFKKLWKGKLDKMVNKLQNNGVESTPYEDKRW